MRLQCWQRMSISYYSQNKRRPLRAEVARLKAVAVVAE